MMILNDAADIRLGADTVEAVYLGEDKVWPSGGDYTQIDWIQATGTQYIDTGYTQQSDSVKIEIFSHIYGGSAIFYAGNIGACMAWAGAVYVYYPELYRNGSRTWIQAGGHDPYGDSAEYLLTLILNPSTCSISDGVTTNSTSGGDASVNATPYCLFADCTGETPDRFIQARIMHCKIYDGGTLVRDFVPVIRNADSKPGLWDDVTQQFYTNAGTGEFVVPT